MGRGITPAISAPSRRHKEGPRSYERRLNSGMRWVFCWGIGVLLRYEFVGALFMFGSWLELQSVFMQIRVSFRGQKGSLKAEKLIISVFGYFEIEICVNYWKDSDFDAMKRSVLLLVSLPWRNIIIRAQCDLFQIFERIVFISWCSLEIIGSNVKVFNNLWQSIPL